MADLWRSKSLIYRAPEAEDEAFLSRLFSHSESLLQNSCQLAVPRGRDAAEKWLATFKTRLCPAIICLPAAGGGDTDAPMPIGYISIRCDAEQVHHRHATLGIFMMRVQQGKGYGSEAIKWALDWGFRMGNLHRIELEVFAWNTRAIALYERLGFVHESRRREHRWFDGAYRDEICMGMLDREWRDRQAKMEPTSRYSPTIFIDNMASHYLNPEDLQGLMSPSPSCDSDPKATSATPAPVLVHSKPAKKRKSWGQSLPEPTTALPPRKRAKTDDEKEQRRIERIKRNRAAAHNSRERKRQETETLAVALARANAMIDAYRSLHGPLPAHVVLPEVTLISTDPGDTPGDSHGTYDPPSPESLPQDEDDEDYSYESIKQEPFDISTPYLPPAPENFDAKPLDPTQHSAAMLCDLPSYDAAAADYLQDPAPGTLGPFALENGGFDACFNAPLDFSFDDLINDTATVAVGGHGAL
ncbi:transcription factor that binds to CRE motif [Teratosphaeriaceae sp. CCFEE 6253]|nr:transcription factor that binds to CRE motif [Teratosphaeriaceae sp. CCFEE 6253]